MTWRAAHGNSIAWMMLLPQALACKTVALLQSTGRHLFGFWAIASSTSMEISSWVMFIRLRDLTRISLTLVRLRWAVCGRMHALLSQRGGV